MCDANEVSFLRRPPGNRTRSSRHIRAVPSQLARGLWWTWEVPTLLPSPCESAALPLSYTSLCAWSRACSHRRFPGFGRALHCQSFRTSVVRPGSVELPSAPWRGAVVPLDYDRMFGTRASAPHAAKGGFEPPATMGNGHPLFR